MVKLQAQELEAAIMGEISRAFPDEITQDVMLRNLRSREPNLTGHDLCVYLDRIIQDKLISLRTARLEVIDSCERRLFDRGIATEVNYHHDTGVGVLYKLAPASLDLRRLKE